MKIKKGRLTLYLTGAATAIGLAAVLMEEMNKAHKRVEKKKPSLKNHIIDFKKKLTQREKKVSRGKIEWLKKVEDRVSVKKPKEDKKEPKPKGKPVDEVLMVKNAAITYIADEMMEKLKEMGLDYPELIAMTDMVSEEVDRLISELDLNKYIKETGLNDTTIIRLIELIKPKLLERIKKARKG